VNIKYPSNTANSFTNLATKVIISIYISIWSITLTLILLSTHCRYIGKYISIISINVTVVLIHT